MKIIQTVLQKTKASELWLLMVVFIAMHNVTSAEAKSLKKGEVFVSCDCCFSKGFCIKGDKGTISVVSSDEVEIDGGGRNILLGNYTIDGERVRVVTSALGTAMVTYFKITQDGLIEEKGGRVFYSKDGLQAKEKIVKSEKNRRATAVIAARFTFIGSEVTDKKRD